MAISTKDMDGVRYIILGDIVDIAQASDLKHALTAAIGSLLKAMAPSSPEEGVNVLASQ